MAEQFNMYTTEKKKVVREMVVFLHHHYIIFAVDLMEGKEYDYWEHIEVSAVTDTISGFVKFTSIDMHGPFNRCTCTCISSTANC